MARRMVRVALMADRLAFRRAQVPSFDADLAQRSAQQAAQKTNVLADRLDRQILLALAQDFVTTATSLVATPLAFPVRAGENWLVEVWADAACSSVNGMVYALGAPAGSQVRGWVQSSSTNTAVANWFVGQFTAANTASTACHVGATNAGRPDRIEARIEAATDGTISILVAGVSASTTTISRQAALRATRYARV